MADEWRQALDESIRKWEARPQFGELTPEVLARVPDDLLEQAIIDFVCSFREWPEDRLLALLTTLPVGFSTVCTTWWLDAEVANGGFHQYFWNSGGVYVDLVKDGLQRLKAAEHLHTFEQAVHLAGLQTKPAVARLAARVQLEAFSESARARAFDHLDSRWYELGELRNARVRFIRDNPTLLVARLPTLARVRLRLSALLLSWKVGRSRR